MRASAIQGRQMAAALLFLTTVLGVLPAAAHPHVWLDTRATFKLDGDGRLTALETLWRFDDMFSALEVDGRDADRDGTVSREELAQLARDLADHLHEWRYFTVLIADGRPVPLGPAEAPVMDFRDGRLEFSLRLPLPEPVPADGLRLAIFDPSFFMDMRPEQGAKAVTLAGPVAASCSAEVKRMTQKAPAFVPEELATDTSPEDDPLTSTGARFAEWITLTCTAA